MSKDKQTNDEIARNLCSPAINGTVWDWELFKNRIKEVLDLKDSYAEELRRENERLTKIFEQSCEDNDRWYKERNTSLLQQLEQAKKEIHDFRSIDRHKDSDWGKWYDLYYSKYDEAKLAKEQLEIAVEALEKVRSEYPGWLKSWHVVDEALSKLKGIGA